MLQVGWGPHRPEPWLAWGSWQSPERKGGLARVANSHAPAWLSSLVVGSEEASVTHSQRHLCLPDETRGLPGEHGPGRPGGRKGAGPGPEGGPDTWRSPGCARVRALQVPPGAPRVVLGRALTQAHTPRRPCPQRGSYAHMHLQAAALGSQRPRIWAYSVSVSSQVSVGRRPAQGGLHLTGKGRDSELHSCSAPWAPC